MMRAVLVLGLFFVRVYVRGGRACCAGQRRKSALGLSLVIQLITLFGHTVLGIGRFVRGRQDTVFQRQMFQLKRFQQYIPLRCHPILPLMPTL